MTLENAKILKNVNYYSQKQTKMAEKFISAIFFFFSKLNRHVLAVGSIHLDQNPVGVSPFTAFYKLVDLRYILRLYTREVEPVCLVRALRCPYVE